MNDFYAVICPRCDRLCFLKIIGEIDSKNVVTLMWLVEDPTMTGDEINTMCKEDQGITNKDGSFYCEKCYALIKGEQE
jgi:hypothetical protein